MTNSKNYQTTLSGFFWQVMKPYKWWLLLMLQAPIIGAFYVPVNNYALKLIIDQISQNQDFSLQHVIFPIILFCSSCIILEIGWRFANFADYKSQPKIEAEIINQGYAMLLTHNYQFFQNNLSGKIASKVVALRDRYVYIFDCIHHQIIWQLLSIFITLSIFFSVHSKLAIGVTVWLLIFMPLMFFTKRKGLNYSEKSTAEKQKISGLINDGISNIANVLFFRARNFELNLIRNANNDFIKSEKTRLRFVFLNHLVIGLIYCALSISVLFLLIDLRRKNLVSIGDFVMVMSLSFYLIESTWGLLNNADSLIADFGHLKESFTIFTQAHQIYDVKDAQNLVIKKPTIEFKNLTYSHHKDNPVFNNFNLEIQAGQRIGLVGHSGAGKSTLINLLLKVFTPNDGEILIDGKNISDLTFDSLRQNIALIPQDPMLFHRTIFENIAYGKIGASKEEVIAAAKKAHIHDFIITLANGYDTLVGERGIKLSGGQRQRIAIARAILKNAPILILDEATSSLDSETESQIQASINAMLAIQNITVIAIAHRLSTIKNLDRIIVMDSGKIIEDGSFAQLISKEDGRFKELWIHQAEGMVI
jgi:ATP-binding cassette subfamily B protein